VAFDPISHSVGLAYVDSREVIFLITDQNVDTRSIELGSLPDFHPSGAWKSYA
jgi:hypothetical protein